MSNNKLTSIESFYNKRKLNIGTILFGIILIYLLITIIGYLTSSRISIYEVREGSIFKDTSYTGIVLRQEEIVPAQTDGYVNYFITEESKVGMNNNLCCISDDTLDFNSIETEEDIKTDETLTTEEASEISQLTRSFVDSFSFNRFTNTYTFKNSISDKVQVNTTQSKLAKLDSLIESGQSGVNVYKAEKDGVILYSIDGFESLSKDQVTKDILRKTNYESKSFTDNMSVRTGDPIYKLVTDETWTLAIELDHAMVKELGDSSYVKVRFTKDDTTMWGKYSVEEKDGINIAFFTFNKAMVRYASDRFLNVELILEDQSGLKIPKTSVVKKDFYAIPYEYLTLGGGANNNYGVLVKETGDSAQFKESRIFYHDIETDLVYLDCNDFSKNTELIKPESTETISLDTKISLNGVFCVNKGYAVFRHINVICESKEYYIISSGSRYGLSNYDHIALDGTEVHENELVF